MPVARRLRSPLLLIVASLACGLAHADPADRSGWYVGASAGQTDLSYPFDWERDSDGYAVRGGYRFGRHFALEGGYADLGNSSFTIECPPLIFCLIEQYPLAVKQEFSQATVSAVGILPIGDRFELFAKVGYARAFYRSTSRPIVAPVSRFSDDSDETIVGIGGRAHLGSSWSVRLEWDRTEVWDIEFDGYWLGLDYRFGR